MWLQATSNQSVKISNDPHFAEKLEDVVGFYISPPDNAVIFCIDEKSSIHALDHTHPGLPLKKGRSETMTNDYKRHGTSTLFAALDVSTGKVIGECTQTQASGVSWFLKDRGKTNTKGQGASRHRG